MDILLNEKERLKIMSAWCRGCAIKGAASNYLSIEAVRHTLKYLNEPCENWQHRTPMASEYKVIPHRYLCPECMEEIEKEINK